MGNIEDCYDKSHSERSTIDPIIGDASLHIQFTDWSNAILPVVYPWREGPAGYSLTANSKIRINSATVGTTIKLCAVAYYMGSGEDGAGGDERYEQCETVDTSLEGILELAPTLMLDHKRQLNRVYFWLKFEHNGVADITLDDTHLILDVAPNN